MACNTHHQRHAQSHGQAWGYLLEPWLHCERATKEGGPPSAAAFAGGLQRQYGACPSGLD